MPKQDVATRINGGEAHLSSVLLWFPWVCEVEKALLASNIPSVLRFYPFKAGLKDWYRLGRELSLSLSLTTTHKPSFIISFIIAITPSDRNNPQGLIHHCNHLVR